MILTIEKAIIPTITPTIHHKKAVLANLTFSGSPPEVRNKTPATIKAIKAISPNTIQIGLFMAVINASRLFMVTVG